MLSGAGFEHFKEIPTPKHMYNITVIAGIIELQKQSAAKPTRSKLEFFLFPEKCQRDGGLEAHHGRRAIGLEEQVMRQRMHHPKTDGVLDQGGKRRKKKIANVWPTKSRMSKIRKIFMHTVLEKFQ